MLWSRMKRSNLVLRIAVRSSVREVVDEIHFHLTVPIVCSSHLGKFGALLELVTGLTLEIVLVRNWRESSSVCLIILHA